MEVVCIDSITHDYDCYWVYKTMVHDRPVTDSILEAFNKRRDSLVAAAH